MSYTVYMHIAPNGKKYVGITKQYPVSKRWLNGGGYLHNEHFNRAIKKYGWENIEHKIISNWHTQEEAEKLERYLIKYYQSNNRNYGYNKTDGGETNKKLSIESIRKMSEAQLGKKLSEETKSKIRIAMKKRGMTDSHKKHLSKIQKNRIGTKHNKITKQKISQANKGKLVGNKNPMYGKHHSKETKFKISHHREYENGANHSSSKRVAQIDKKGRLIKVWGSCSLAQKNFRKEYSSGVKACCQGRSNTAYGYIWEYVDDSYEITPLQNYPYKVDFKANINNRKKVIQYSLDGVAIKEFDSITEAKNEMTNSKSLANIHQVCKGKRKTAYGYIWKYAEEENNELQRTS